MTTRTADDAPAPIRIAVPRAARARADRRALLLDRDGVVNVDFGYVSRPGEIAFLPGLFPLCRTARALGMGLVIVTNQSGIGRGLYSLADFVGLSRWMTAAFDERAAPLDAIYACPHRAEDGCGCRKPRPGLFHAAAADLDLDLSRSVAIGDRPRDIEAAVAAGVGRTFLLGSEAWPDLRSIETALPAP